ncbi:MAG: UDP-N-acetylmuramate dehydrogenase [Clostridia bacterium]|nr:UDP-N-acetylmuramate dehydrogenase [Clostridia bacterium]
MNFGVPADIIKQDFSLSAVSSMRTGGKAKYAFFPKTREQLIHILKATQDEKNRLVVGNSSNILFPDDASHLTVIFTTKMTNCEKTGDFGIYSSCGTMLTEISLHAAKRSLTGLEFAFGIPGTLGGGVFMNAGAYGGELSNVIKSVDVFDTLTGEEYAIPVQECRFSYRHSIFMENKNLVVLGALLELAPGNADEITAKNRANMNARREKQPLEFPSCGSAFKRPEGHFAGKLIEDCGLKGFSIGGAAISEKHAGFVINCGGATSADVRNLMDEVTKRVFEKFGVTLCPEIEITEEP